MYFTRLGAGLVGAGLLLAACSDVSVNSPATIFATPNWGSFDSGKKSAASRMVTADELVNPEGQCAGADTTVAAAPATGAPELSETRGVGLDMTECQVVRRVGKPDRVEVGADPGGKRATVLTYLTGVRPGIYHFANGRLKQVEAAPEPPAPPKPQKRAKPKTATAN